MNKNTMDKMNYAAASFGQKRWICSLWIGLNKEMDSTIMQASGILVINQWKSSTRCCLLNNQAEMA